MRIIKITAIYGAIIKLMEYKIKDKSQVSRLNETLVIKYINALSEHTITFRPYGQQSLA